MKNYEKAKKNFKADVILLLVISLPGFISSLLLNLIAVNWLTLLVTLISAIIPALLIWALVLIRKNSKIAGYIGCLIGLNFIINGLLNLSNTTYLIISIIVAIIIINNAIKYLKEYK